MLAWPLFTSQRATDLHSALPIGVGIDFVNIDPIKALFWSAVINGVVAVPLMVVMMIMTMQPKIMGQFTLPRPLWAIGWLSTAAMAVAVVIMLATWGG